MSDLRVTNLRGRTTGVSPTLPDGAVVTGITTSTSVIVGSAVTINSTGIDAGAGIITARGLEATGIVTATSFVGTLTGSATTIAGAPNVTLGNVNAGVITATTFVGVPAGFTELDAALFN